MCDLCRADENYFHTPECVYGQLVSEYPAGFDPLRGDCTELASLADAL
ncbi:hypothetical protein [Enterobacter bugandensis]|nr:hypothetical protein [Enterobacter bugandensis]